jgi:CheY-like chemotaxis protein
MRRVLCVDDEPDALFLFKVVFSGAGYEVIEAAHGQDALDQIEGRAPDLVVTDLMMPVMDGGALIEQLRSRPETAGIPIVLVTANPNAGVAADAVVSKPFRPAYLLEVAAGLLDGNGSDASS